VGCDQVQSSLSQKEKKKFVWFCAETLIIQLTETMVEMA
jgi:hypothetical protein